jgi:DNA-binding CsgD family transcriptional regulator
VIGHPALLEREGELATLSAALTAAHDGQGGVVLVEGETGTGKSALLAAAEHLGGDLRLTTLLARASELERDFPFGVVLQLLERLVCGLPRAERDSMLDGPARMAVPLFPALRTAGDEHAEDPFAVVHGAYWLVARLAERSPLLLAVDDAQWIDERSLQVLRYLAGRVEDLPVLLLAAGTRDPAPGAAPLDVLARAGPAVTLCPGPLSEAAVERVVRSEFPDADAGFCAGCAAATAGVPLLVHELLAAIRNNALPPTARTTEALPRLGLPEVARAVLGRLEALPDGTPDLARTAAVLGDDAELRHTAHLAGLDLGQAAVALDALCASGIAEPDETVRFRHPIVRSALEGSVPPAGRAHVHLQVARLLLGEAAPPERVAGHLLLAERGGRRWVVETLRRAATRAMSEGAPASAARHLERALAEPPDPDARPEVLLELARAEAAAGLPTAPERIRAALEPVEDADHRARALAELVHVPGGHGERPAVVAAFEEGLRHASEHDADPEATRWLEATLLAEAREVPELRVRALRLLGAAGPAHHHSAGGRAVMAQRAYEAALASRPAVDVRDLAEHALGRGALLREDRPGGPHVAATVRALTLAGDVQSAELVLAVAMERARESGSPEAYARVCALRADVSLRRGSLADAIGDAGTALEAPGDRPGAWATATLALALTEAGDHDEAAERLDGFDLDAVSPAGAAFVLAARSRVRLAAGDAEGAYADAIAAGERLGELRADAPALVPWRSDAALAVLGRDPAEARKLVAVELDLAGRAGAPRALGVALRTAGLAEGGERGLELLRESAGLLEDAHAPLEHARALAELGAGLRAARRPVDARAPLRSALALAHRCGAQALEGRVHAELAASGARVVREDPADAETLTPIERRVVDLATDGLGAGAIADALFLTVKSVEWHLRSASRKLGVRSHEELLDSLGARRDESGNGEPARS